MTWRISLNNRVFFFERKIKSQVRPVRNGLKVGCNLYRPLCFKIQKKGLREPYTWPTFLPIFTIISSRRTKITICYKLVFNKKKNNHGRLLRGITAFIKGKLCSLKSLSIQDCSCAVFCLLYNWPLISVEAKIWTRAFYWKKLNNPEGFYIKVKRCLFIFNVLVFKCVQTCAWHYYDRNKEICMSV